jgi:hypothetical protein
LVYRFPRGRVDGRLQIANRTKGAMLEALLAQLGAFSQAAEVG